MYSQLSEYRIAFPRTCLGEDGLKVFNSLTFDFEIERQEIDAVLETLAKPILGFC